MIQSAFTERQKKKYSFLILSLILILCILICYFVGKPMIEFVKDSERFKAWVDSYGFISQIIFVAMVFLQVVIAIIPGEPLEIAAGYAFGTLEGTLLCIIGIVLGSAVIYIIVKKFGYKLVEALFPKRKIDSIAFLKNPRNLTNIVFLVMFIPGTPKDLQSYAVGLTEMKLSTWLLIAGVARIPSIITSTIAGNFLGTQNYLLAFYAFVITGVISLGGLYIYNRYFSQKEEQIEANNQ